MKFLVNIKPVTPAKLPHKNGRPRASDYQKARHQFRYQRIPRTILESTTSTDQKGSKKIPRDNPFRERAIYVVHGMGEQENTETAANLRWTIEEVLPDLDPKYWYENQLNNWIVPPPYIQDGYWARYHDFQWLAPEEYRDLTNEQKIFFTNLWKHRALGAFRSWSWLVKQNYKLLFEVELRHKISLALLFLLVTVPMLFMMLIPSARNFLRNYINDIRLYLAPNGEIENEIVQRIDRRVGAQFLELLGLDWDFNELPLESRLYIGTDPETFEEITWDAHSLGSVISYNVISDILHKCSERRDSLEAKVEESGGTTEEMKKEEKLIRKVERSFNAFITLGSPLDKVFYLFNECIEDKANGVIRSWPARYLPGGTNEIAGPELSKIHNEKNDKKNDDDLKEEKHQHKFWINFYHNSDPISGHLSRFVNKQKESIVENIHIAGVRIPGWSHLHYWKDEKIISRILENTFHGYTKHVSIKRRPNWRQRICIALSLIYWPLIIFAVPLIAILIYFRWN